MRKLTRRQAQVLDEINRYIGANGFPPSLRDLKQLLGITSLRGVTVHLDALEHKGYIKREPYVMRGIRVLRGVSKWRVGQAVWIPSVGLSAVITKVNPGDIVVRDGEHVMSVDIETFERCWREVTPDDEPPTAPHDLSGCPFSGPNAAKVTA